VKPPETKSPKPAVAYSYLRFSSPEQAKGDSVRHQTALRDAWLEKNPHVRLDTDLKMTDSGVSAFTGGHRQNPDRHALAAFLEAVRPKKVPRGSHLLVESLDRLSREHIQPALILFLELLQAGVRVVQLAPVEQVFTDKSESMTIMMAVMELSRGHSESAVKQFRMRESWAKKRRAAAASGAVITSSCPAWIRVEGKGGAARYALVAVGAEIVRGIFRMAIDGMGVRLILKELLAENVPPIGRKPWNVSYIKVLLRNRAAFGEFTARTGRGSAKNRKAVGPPIVGYYPAAISEEDFYATQAAVAARRVKGGRPAKERVTCSRGCSGTPGREAGCTSASTRGRTRLSRISFPTTP
jgi:DNA invertase Pin-like site-specific DNA recombinase